MKTIELTKIIRKLAADHGKRVFTLRDVVACSGESAPSVAMALLRLKKHGVVDRIGSLWINMLDRPAAEEVAFSLRAASYVSFESALYEKGILSQSPRGILALATTGRPGRVRTPVGEIEFVHLKPTLFFGYDERRIAYPEKALLDLAYIRTKRGLGALPGMTFYFEELDRRRFAEFAGKFPPSISTALKDIFQARRRRAIGQSRPKKRSSCRS